MSNHPPSLQYSPVAPFRHFRYLRLSLMVVTLACITMAMSALHLLLQDAPYFVLRREHTVRAAIVLWLDRYEYWPAFIALIVAACDILLWITTSCFKKSWSTAPDGAFWLRIIFDSTSLLCLIAIPRIGDS